MKKIGGIGNYIQGIVFIIILAIAYFGLKLSPITSIILALISWPISYYFTNKEMNKNGSMWPFVIGTGMIILSGVLLYIWSAIAGIHPLNMIEIILSLSLWSIILIGIIIIWFGLFNLINWPKWIKIILAFIFAFMTVYTMFLILVVQSGGFG